MTWGLAGNVARLASLALRSLGITPSGNERVMSGPVPGMSSKSRGNGATDFIAARAERVCNRNRRLVRMYRAKHEALSRGRSGDAQSS